MIAVISPAKTLDYDTKLPLVTPTKPRFAEEAASLADPRRGCRRSVCAS